MNSSNFTSKSGLIVAAVLVSLMGSSEATASDECVVVLEAEQESEVAKELAGETRCKVVDMEWLQTRCASDASRECDGLMDAPDLLSSLSRAHSVALYIEFVNDGWDLFVRVVDQKGNEVAKSRLDSASASLGPQHSPMILQAVDPHLPEEAPASPAVTTKNDSTPDTEDVSQPAPNAEIEAPRGDDGSPTPQVSDSMTSTPEKSGRKGQWLRVWGSFEVTQRLLVLSDVSQRSSNLRTPLSPGYRFGGQIYPFSGSDRLGFEVSFAHGFDDVTFVRNAENIESSVSRLGASVAAVYRVRDYQEGAYYEGTQTLLKAGLNWRRYSMDKQLVTPLDTNHVAIEFGLTILQSVYRDLLGFDWSITAQPWVGDLSQNDLGSQDWGLGLATHLAFGVQPFDGLIAKLGWGANGVRTWYSGPAFSDYEDVSSIVFEHSPSLSLEYGW